MSYFTQEAIADIGLSSVPGFLDRGKDDILAEKLDGSTTTAYYSDAIHSNLTATSHLVWGYQWYPSIRKLMCFFSAKYRQLFQTGDDFDGIVLHQTRQRLRRYLEGENLEDFFQAMMEDKDGKPHQLPFGEIFAELNVMCRCILRY